MALGASILEALIVGELTYIDIGGIVIDIEVVLLKAFTDSSTSIESLLQTAL